jgi:hypothetical protein
MKEVAIIFLWICGIMAYVAVCIIFPFLSCKIYYSTFLSIIYTFCVNLVIIFCVAFAFACAIASGSMAF